MADTVVISQPKPYKIEVEAGIYWWCACGRSHGQPFCDGSHKGSSFTPLKVEIGEKSTVAFCGCKHSRNGARCDGAHKTLRPTE